jgi:hypothetical protein
MSFCGSHNPKEKLGEGIHRQIEKDGYKDNQQGDIISLI